MLLAQLQQDLEAQGRGRREIDEVRASFEGAGVKRGEAHGVDDAELGVVGERVALHTDLDLGVGRAGSDGAGRGGLRDSGGDDGNVHAVAAQILDEVQGGARDAVDGAEGLGGQEEILIDEGWREGEGVGRRWRRVHGSICGSEGGWRRVVRRRWGSLEG